MGIISFFKEAGEKLFGHKETEAAAQQAQADPAAAQAKSDELNRAAAAAITQYITAQNLSADGLAVSFDGASATATVEGVAADQATKEKIVLCCGNVTGVAAVSDLMPVAAPAD